MTRSGPAPRADAAEASRGYHRPVPFAISLPPQYTELTEREREILKLMVESLSNTEIAEELYISEKTVRNYVSHIYEVLRTPSRSQAVRWAVDNGVVPALRRRAGGTHEGTTPPSAASAAKKAQSTPAERHRDSAE